MSTELAPTQSAPVSPQRDVGLDDVVEAFEIEGRVRDKTAAAVKAQGRRFQNWCVENGAMENTDPGDFAALPASMLSLLIVAHLADISTGLKTETVKQYKAGLFAWFFQHCIDAEAARIPADALVSNQKYTETEKSEERGVINRQDGEIRPARPVLWDDCVMIVNHIDSLKAETYGVTKLWLLGMRTFQLVQWNGLFRCSEAAVHMTWSWWTDGDDFMITPGDDVLKYQPKALRAPFRHHRNLSLCCHHALRKWKAALKKAGFPTGPDDPVFPAIARTERIEKSDAWSGPVRDFYGEAAAEADELGLEKGSAEHQYWMEAPTKEQRQRWADGLKELHLSAGFTARHAGERISSHGNRRGPATQMHINGASVPQIGAALRHQDISVTHRYIHLEPGEVLNTSDIDLGQQTHPTTTGAPITMADFTETAGEPERKTCGVEHDGQVCPREFSVNATVDGVEYACCSAHYERAKKLNKSGTEFTKPIGLCALIDACEVTHEGRACGKSTFAWLTVEAQRLCCCAAHYHRHWAAGKTGADFTKPIRKQARRQPLRS
jgi:hypothetical protein